MDKNSAYSDADSRGQSAFASQFAWDDESLRALVDAIGDTAELAMKTVQVSLETSLSPALQSSLGTSLAQLLKQVRQLRTGMLDVLQAHNAAHYHEAQVFFDQITQLRQMVGYWLTTLNSQADQRTKLLAQFQAVCGKSLRMTIALLDQLRGFRDTMDTRDEAASALAREEYFLEADELSETQSGALN